MMPDNLLLWAAGALFIAGGAWSVVIMKENQNRNKIQEFEDELEASVEALDHKIDALSEGLTEHQFKVNDKLARLETKIDLLLAERDG